MSSPNKSPRLARFGPFAADLNSGELWRDGIRIRLQVQPFEILKVFLERPNELITRDELQSRVWPADTFVDFERGLNKAVNKLRDALCDQAESPRYIETIPRRGYRFIAPVELDPLVVVASEQPALIPPLSTRVGKLSSTKWVALVAAMIGLLAIALLSLARKTKPESIAVLPLSTSGADTDYTFADGLTDSLINNLSLVPKLRVISHASVFEHRGRTGDPRIIGQKLNVTAVLTGQVEKVGDEMTLSLELTATSDSRHLWGQKYTRPSAEWSLLSQEAAGAVADALRLSLTPARKQEIGSHNAADAEAQQLYLKGRYYFFKETPEDNLKARGLFQSAIDRDPSYALAYAALGDTYDWMATEGYQPAAEVVPQATAAKLKANELNAASAEVHASLAALEFIQWNWQKADTEFQKALRINPNYFEAHRLYSIYLRSMHRYPEAIQQAKLCDELNPLLMPAKSHLALTYYYAREYEAAAAQYRLILKDNPDDAGAHAGLSRVLIKQGKEKEAVQEWQRSLTLGGDEASAEAIAHNYVRGGYKAAQTVAIRAELKSLDKLASTYYVSPLDYAYRYALLNDKENAFLWLEKAYRERSPQLFNLNVDPDYDNLREDPRFSDLVSRLHLPFTQ